MTDDSKPRCIIFNSGMFKVIDLNCDGVNKEIEGYLINGFTIAGISGNARNQTNYMYLVRYN
jgi:hypothetical protein